MKQIDFYTSDNMAQFWDFTKGLLQTTAPGIMLWFAVTAVGIVLTIIVKAFRQSSKEDDEDDEIEVRHY
ncbi:hypothetical protein LCY76_22730 [Fictibacillus sp. KIGAM418]|uniref:Uncharacterized protein n=1 Tax=Fictibacillus marinisediminis TaxID=2878389 RepID=A0A9X2BF67_9BACL|nr:hypothetical protein [Fictibacillus marinisediminis]MCK6259391.1 hypothetical protein [Fictibacillus marinisediminis]